MQYLFRYGLWRWAIVGLSALASLSASARVAWMVLDPVALAVAGSAELVLVIAAGVFPLLIAGLLLIDARLRLHDADIAASMPERTHQPTPASAARPSPAASRIDDPLAAPSLMPNLMPAFLPDPVPSAAASPAPAAEPAPALDAVREWQFVRQLDALLSAQAEDARRGARTDLPVVRHPAGHARTDRPRPARSGAAARRDSAERVG